VLRVSPADDARSRFIADLHAEAAAFADFFELLRTEQAALAARDIDALLQVAPSKSEHIGALNGMAQWLLVHGRSDSAVLSATWHRLLETAARAQALNRENGVLIETRLQHNQRLLSALASGAQPSLYGPDGQTRMGGPGRDLGKV
jgi:flagella synthesis protein FlgN